MGKKQPIRKNKLPLSFAIRLFYTVNIKISISYFDKWVKTKPMKAMRCKAN